MGEGLAKTASQSNPTPVENKSVSPGIDGTFISLDSYEGVPTDVYKYFGLNVRDADVRTLGQLKGIWEFVSKNTNSYGKALQALRRIERKLGSPHRESRCSKMHNWVAIRSYMQKQEGKQREAQKERLSALEGGELDV